MSSKKPPISSFVSSWFFPFYSAVTVSASAAAVLTELAVAPPPLPLLAVKGPPMVTISNISATRQYVSVNAHSAVNGSIASLRELFINPWHDTCAPSVDKNLDDLVFLGEQ